MTVQQLIEELNKVYDKTLPVVFSTDQCDSFEVSGIGDCHKLTEREQKFFTGFLCEFEGSYLPLYGEN